MEGTEASHRALSSFIRWELSIIKDSDNLLTLGGRSCEGDGNGVNTGVLLSADYANSLKKLLRQKSHDKKLTNLGILKHS